MFSSSNSYCILEIRGVRKNVLNSSQRFCCGPSSAPYCCSLARKWEEEPLFDPWAHGLSGKRTNGGGGGDSDAVEEIVYRYTYTETWSVSPWGAVMLLTFGFFSTFIVVYFFGAVLLTVCNAYCA